LLLELVLLDQGAHVVFNGDDGTEEEKAAKLQDSNLATNFVQVATIGTRASDSRFGDRTSVSSSDGWVAGALHNVADAGKNDADQDTNNKIVDPHDQDDGKYGEILELVAFAPGVPQCFLHKVDPEEEDEGADQTNWDIANHSRACDPYCSRSSSKQYTSSSTVTAIVDEHYAIGIHKVVLGLY
jgi:hypothetical protein